MADSILQFYDQLSADYHLIFADWKQSMLRQGEILDRQIRAQLGSPPFAILDCTCGIGTQAIPLALKGHQVHASDLSPASVARAQHEAEALDAKLTFGVADVRRLTEQVEGLFDVVISCDNALPHMLTEADLWLAAQGLWTKLRDHGLLLLSMRDYDQLVAERPAATVPSPFSRPEGKQVYFQLWNWHEDGRSYAVDFFILKERDGVWQTDHYTTDYRALLRNELNEILQATGFTDLRWLMPEETGYYQPLLIARKRP